MCMKETSKHIRKLQQEMDQRDMELDKMIVYLIDEHEKSERLEAENKAFRKALEAIAKVTKSSSKKCIACCASHEQAHVAIKKK